MLPVLKFCRWDLAARDSGSKIRNKQSAEAYPRRETNGFESAKEPQPSDSPEEEDICVYSEETANSGDAIGSDFSQVAEEDIPSYPSLTKRGGRRKHQWGDARPENPIQPCDSVCAVSFILWLDSKAQLFVLFHVMVQKVVFLEADVNVGLAGCELA